MKLAGTRLNNDIRKTMEMENSHAAAAADFVFDPKLSLYIPVVGEVVNEAVIREVFVREQLGQVARVDFIHNRLGKKQAFVHVACWNDTEYVRELQRHILDPTQRARLIYDPSNSKFWPLLPNRNPLETPRLELIGLLQDKIAALERKLNDVNIMENDDYGVPTKRPRSVNGSENLVVMNSAPVGSPVLDRQNSRSATPPPTM